MVTEKRNVKRIYRTAENKVLTGLFGGLGEYFDIDPTLLRLGFLLIVLLTGIFPGVILYFIAALIVPKKLEVKESKS